MKVLGLSLPKINFETGIMFGAGLIIGRFLLPRLEGSFAGFPTGETGTPGWYYINPDGSSSHHHCKEGEPNCGCTSKRCGGSGKGPFHAGPVSGGGGKGGGGGKHGGHGHHGGGSGGYGG